MPGRFKDYIAVPKLNGYQSLHTTVIGPHGKPLEIQIRTHEMHQTAEFGIAAHWRYKAVGGDGPGSQEWLSRMMDWQRDTKDPGEFLEALRSDLHQEEVFVFTPKGEVRALAAGATPLDFAYEIHTDVGHRCVGAKVNGRIVPLSYTLASGDFVEILTSKAPRGPSRDWVNLVTTGKARSKIRQFFLKERREDAEHRGRDLLQEHLKKAGLPSQKMVASPLLHQVITEMGFKKAEDFYISLGMTKTSVHTVVNKVIARLKAGQAVAEEPPSALPTKASRSRSAAQSTELGVEIEGLPDVLARMAKCCKPVPGDEIVGYISLGRGITIHRSECPNVKSLARAPERFTPVSWVGASRQSFRVEIAVDAWDRVRLLEDLSRTLSESGANIIMAHCQGEDQMVRNRFTVELGDVSQIKGLIAALRGVDGVFDAYRVGPGR
jgi:GTP pyrophosphokinase